MPVVSVAEARKLQDAGRLDGRVVAIGGFFSWIIHSCPSSGTGVGPLLRSTSCTAAGFADSEADARVCHAIRNGMSCQEPGSTMVPLGMPETSGGVPYRPDPDDPFTPSRIVVLAHADDARQWQCAPLSLAECKRALVADRFVWVNGASVNPDEPELWDELDYRQIPLHLNLSDVQLAVSAEHFVTAAPFQAKDIWSVDPRWNLAGDEVVWLIRTLTSESESPDATRAAEVSLVDDATGDILDSHDLAIDPTYAPGRLWLESERRDLDALSNIPDELVPFFRIRAADGVSAHESRVSGSRLDGTTGPSLPVLLPAGDYTVETWLASYVDGVQALPTRSCATNLHLDPLDDVGLLAYYDPDRECAWMTFAPPT